MSRRISAKILLSVLVAFSATFFILKTNVKADTVQPYTFLYSTRYTAIQDTGVINERYQLTAEINIASNHEVSGRYVVYFFYDTSSTSNMTLLAKNITVDGGQIDNVLINSGVCSFNVLVTGQKEVTVRVVGASNNRTSLFQVDGISFSETDNNNNQIVDNTSMYYRVTKIEDTIYQMFTELIGQGTTLSKIATYISNLDNNLDTITWRNQNKTFRFDPEIKNDWVTIGTSVKVYINEYTVSNNILYKLRLPIQVQSNIGEKIFVDFYNDNYKVNTVDYYITNEYTGLYLYFWGRLNMNNNFYIKIYTTNANIRSTSINTYSPQLLSIDSNDIEYWQLINYFENYNYFNQQKEDNKTIIQRLTELINGNSKTNQSVSDNDQTTSQLNTQTDQYNQIESTFQSSFNTEQTQIKEQLNVNPLTSFSKTALWFTDQLTNLYNRSGNFKILFTLPLILGLAMYFIGRGRKVAAPNTVEHYKLVESAEAGEGRTVYKTTSSTARKRAFRDRSKT